MLYGKRKYEKENRRFRAELEEAYFVFIIFVCVRRKTGN